MIETIITKVTHKGDGVTTVFPYSFALASSSDVHVAIYDAETEKSTVLTRDYYVDTVMQTVTYPGYAPGQEPAESERPAVLNGNQTITIYRETARDQTTDLGSKYPLPQVEAMSDKLTLIAQELSEQLERSVKVAVGDPETPEQRYLEMQTYVSATRQSAAEAASSADYAQDMANDAAASEHNAATSASSAKASADRASNAALSAGNSANTATAKASQANTSASRAQSSATAAAGSAYAANASANNAASDASKAKASAQAAAQSAGDAGDAANRAKSSAIDAAGMLSQTAAYANQADQKLAAVNAMSVPAWDPFTSYSYPAVVAYTDGNTYRCIGQNIPPGTIPYNSSHWVRISVLGGDDFFDIDEWGGIMPRNYPTYSAYWSLDETGGIMPKGTEDEIIDATTTPAERAAAEATAAAKRAEDAQYLETDSDGNVTFKATT